MSSTGMRHQPDGTATSTGMNPNAKIFLAVFLLIGGLAGLVLAIVNASQQPAETTLAVVFGAAGLVLLIGGALLIRRKRY